MPSAGLVTSGSIIPLFLTLLRRGIFAFRNDLEVSFFVIGSSGFVRTHLLFCLLRFRNDLLELLFAQALRLSIAITHFLDEIAHIAVVTVFVVVCELRD